MGTPLPTSWTSIFNAHFYPQAAWAIENTQTKLSSIATIGMARTERLIDPTNAIDRYSAKLILEEIQSVEQDTGTELQVVIVDNYAGQYSTPKKFATALFNDWRIGSEEKNNGVLVLVLLEKRRIEIEVGRSLNNYMNNEWTVDLLEREAIPQFKVQQYGQGVYNVVAGVANRLRQVDSGIVVNTMSQSVGNKLDQLANVFAFGLFGAAAILAAAGRFLDNQYPMGSKTCKQCGSNKWTIARDWETITEATDFRSGKMRRTCECAVCNLQDSISKSIPKYDGRRTLPDGTTSYYYNRDLDDSGSDSGGSSDGGGGGGASW